MLYLKQIKTYALVLVANKYLKHNNLKRTHERTAKKSLNERMFVLGAVNDADTPFYHFLFF